MPPHADVLQWEHLPFPKPVKPALSRRRNIMDLRDEFRGMIAAAGKLSAFAQYHDKVAEAKATDRRVCGNCCLWMCRPQCPREGGIGSGKGGPHMNEMACAKFELKPWVADLKAERLAAAEQFAKDADLPIAVR